MSKCLTVVALVLLVLTGAMGLRNISACEGRDALSLESLGSCNLGNCNWRTSADPRTWWWPLVRA